MIVFLSLDPHGRYGKAFPRALLASKETFRQRPAIFPLNKTARALWSRKAAGVFNLLSRGGAPRGRRADPGPRRPAPRGSIQFSTNQHNQ